MWRKDAGESICVSENAARCAEHSALSVVLLCARTIRWRMEEAVCEPTRVSLQHYVVGFDMGINVLHKLEHCVEYLRCLLHPPLQVGGGRLRY
mmetsp:Transcript_4342/g.11352  ORF Transcript_4342/g.11352 Transcript_4342/m.11352 type:complete len:93 (+) Transcript_4342:322-600(+)